MFDTIREREMGLACGSFGLGASTCGDAIAARDRAGANYDRLQKVIPQLKKERDELLKGIQQGEYDLLQKKQEELSLEIIRLKSQLEANKLLARTWQDEPEKRAQLEGLGWGFFKRMFSCNHYTEHELELNQKSAPLEKEESAFNKELEIIRKRLSFQNMEIQRKAVAEKEKEKENLIAQNKDYLKSIEQSRVLWQTKKAADNVVAAQAAQNAERQRKEAENVNNKNQNNTMLLVLMAVAGGVFFMKQSKSQKE